VLVKNPGVVAEYQKLKAKMEASGNMSREKFMNQLQEAFDMAKLQADPMAMVAATREVGKACGYYAPVEKKITLAGNVTLDKMNRLSDRELLELVQGTGNQIAEAVELIEHQIIDEEEAHDDAQALAGPTERFVGLPDEDEGS
jgi:site-specific recombinase XerD